MRPNKLSLFLGLALSAHAAAFAGEVTLFSGTELSGRESVVRADIANLQAVGFNDRTMSLVVHSGRWEACVHANYGGECRVFDEGQHRNLDRFARQISSLREIEGERGNGRGRGRGRDRDREPSLTVYEGQGMRGRSISLRNDANSFVPLGFNDMTQSMVIRGGSWEICQHSDFRGDCRVFGPGEYTHLEGSLQRGISSARRIGDGNDERRGRYEQRDSDGYRDRDRRDGYGGRNASPVELYTEQGFGGQRIPVNDGVRSLVDANLNDTVGSIVIQEGEWEFCQHADFGGQCMVYGPGRYDRLGNMNNQISSLRRVR